MESILEMLIAIARICLVGTHLALFVNHNATALLVAVSVFWTFEEAVAVVKQAIKVREAKRKGKEGVS